MIVKTDLSEKMIDYKKDFSDPRLMLLIGSTGSVGTQAADVARKSGYAVRALCAGRNSLKVEEQIREFHPLAAAMSDPEAAEDLKIRVADTGVKVYSGDDGICEMIADTPADIAVNSVIGVSGLRPTLAVIESGLNLALANKESLVIAGDIVMQKAREYGVSISPIDSEHCAIDQCLRGGEHGEVKKLLITASGGPFYGRTRDQLAQITVDQALAHPTWKMGPKITIDSATLMNKGFEVIEASKLFSIPGEMIEVLIHRESIVHSLVEFKDNSIIAQMSVPDMRLCVQYAIESPARKEAVINELDLCEVGCLHFSKPDSDTFIPLRLARQSLIAGGASTAVLHAANETAVECFLNGKTGFLNIMDTVSYVCEKMPYAVSYSDLDGIMACDAEARRLAKDFLDNN